MHWIKFKTEPIPSAMGKGQGGWRGKIIDRSTRSFDEITETIARKHGTSPSLARGILTEFFNDIIENSRETAQLQQLGDFGSLAVNLRGRFKGVDDTFDPERHNVAFVFRPGKMLKNLKPDFVLENAVEAKSVRIENAISSGKAGVERGTWYMSWGFDTHCNGRYVRMCEGDSVTWSCTLADGTEVSGPCDGIFNNTACTLDFHWPSTIPEAAIGRDITLTFKLRGERADGTPITIRKTVHLYAD